MCPQSIRAAPIFSCLGMLLPAPIVKTFGADRGLKWGAPDFFLGTILTRKRYLSVCTTIAEPLKNGSFSTGGRERASHAQGD